MPSILATNKPGKYRQIVVFSYRRHRGEKFLNKIVRSFEVFSSVEMGCISTFFSMKEERKTKVN